MYAAIFSLIAIIQQFASNEVQCNPPNIVFIVADDLVSNLFSEWWMWMHYSFALSYTNNFEICQIFEIANLSA